MSSGGTTPATTVIMKWDREKAVCEAAAIARIQAPYAPIQRASLQAARLIEAAMDVCGADDLKALDCLMEARRALSPLVDRRILPVVQAPDDDTAAS